MVKPMPLSFKDDCSALISLSVTGEPDWLSTAMVNVVPAGTPVPHWFAALPASRQTMMPSGPRCQPWSVSSLVAADVENGYGLSTCTDETKSFFVAWGIGPYPATAVSLKIAFTKLFWSIDCWIA
jgi:hypothetical protein